MGKTLYVGNLPFQLAKEDLEALFSQAGTVTDVRIITDRMTGQSRGFGFVDMADEESARAAIEQLSGVEVGGRPIRVDEARPRGEPRDDRPSRGAYLY